MISNYHHDNSLFNNLSPLEQKEIYSHIPSKLEHNQSFILLCSTINALKSKILENSLEADSQLKKTLSLMGNSHEVLVEMGSLIDHCEKKALCKTEKMSQEDCKQFENLTKIWLSCLRLEHINTLDLNQIFRDKVEQVWKKGSLKSQFMLQAPAISKAIQILGREKIERILDVHVKFYPDWQNYSLKNSGYTKSYSEDQRLYGCLTAAFSHALAAEINEWVRENENRVDPTEDEIFWMNSNISLFLLNGEPTKIDSSLLMTKLITLACLGRHLIAQIQHPGPDAKHYGALRTESATTFLEEHKDVVNRLKKELSSKNALNSDWLNREEEDVQYIGNLEYRKDELSKFYWSSGLIKHTYLRGGENDQKHTSYKNILEECLFLEGERLHEKLGEFFWWWCQVKPVDLGDPSIAETLFKAMLISKGLPVPGWKKDLIPWVETLVIFDAVEFGKQFSSLWEF